jgi:hypothetical protein
MIQSILAEISQKRRIHLYPSLARDESVFLRFPVFPAGQQPVPTGVSPHPAERGDATVPRVLLLPHSSGAHTTIPLKIDIRAPRRNGLL